MRRGWRVLAVAACPALACKDFTLPVEIDCHPFQGVADDLARGFEAGQQCFFAAGGPVFYGKLHTQPRSHGERIVGDEKGPF